MASEDAEVEISVCERIEAKLDRLIEQTCRLHDEMRRTAQVLARMLDSSGPSATPAVADDEFRSLVEDLRRRHS